MSKAAPYRTRPEGGSNKMVNETFEGKTEGRVVMISMRILMLTCIISLGITGCHGDDATAKDDTVARLVETTRNNLLPVKGGDFLMGDFGERHSSERLPYTGEPNAQPLHEVRLSDFSMLKWKVSNDEYNVFASQNNRRKVNDREADATSERIARLPDSGRFPAMVLWKEAQDYCAWLGEKLGEKMNLPTEAQWEYAARDGGKFYIFATNDGSFRNGVNVISHEQAEAISQDPFFPVPVGSAPANSSGLGDFAKSGLEWVRDWYDDNYYAHSSKLDPAGPAAGDLKVVRGAQASSSVPAMTMARTGRRPDGVDEKVDKLFQEQGFKPIRFGATFRCVTQQ